MKKFSRSLQSSLTVFFTCLFGKKNLTKISYKILIFFSLFLIPIQSNSQTTKIISIDSSAFPKIKGKILSTDTNGTTQDVDVSDFVFRDLRSGNIIPATFDSCETKKDFAMSIVLSVDASGSMFFKYPDMEEIPKILELDFAKRFVTAIELNDTVKLAYHVFDDKLLHLIPLTKDKQSILDYIPNTVYGFNNDFIQQMNSYPDGMFNVVKQGRTKRVAIMITDGVWSVLNQSDINTAINTCINDSIEFYCVLLSTPRTNYSFIQSIKQITDASGGKIYNSVINESKVIEAIGKIQSDIYDISLCSFEFEVEPTCDSLIQIQAYSKKYNIYDTIKIKNPLYKQFQEYTSFDIILDTTTKYINNCDTNSIKFSTEYTDYCNKPLIIDSIIYNGKKITINDSLLYSSKNIGKNIITVYAHNSHQKLIAEKIFYVQNNSDSNFYEVIGNIDTTLHVKDDCSIDSMKFTIKNKDCLPIYIESIQSSANGQLTITIPNTIIDDSLDFIIQYTPITNSTIDTFKLIISNGIYRDTIEAIVRGVIDNPIDENYIVIPDSVYFYNTLCNNKEDTLFIKNTSCKEEVVNINGKDIILQSNEIYPLFFILEKNTAGVYIDSLLLKYDYKGAVISKKTYIITTVEDTIKQYIGQLDINDFKDTSITLCDTASTNILITNNLCTDLIIDSIYITDTNFYLDTSTNKFIIDIDSSLNIPIIFKNNSIAGNYTTDIIIKTKDSTYIRTLSINVIEKDSIFFSAIVSKLTLTDFSIDIISNNDISNLKDIYIDVHFNNPSSYEFSKVLYSSIIKSIDIVYIDSSKLTFKVTFNDNVSINAGDKICEIIGDSYLTIEDSTDFYIDSISYNEEDLSRCKPYAIPINKTILSVDSCGTDLLREFLKKNIIRLSIYPNPSSNGESINIISNINIKSYVVYNIKGNVVKLSGEEYNRNDIIIDSLHKGKYMVVCKYYDGQSVVGSFIILN